MNIKYIQPWKQKKVLKRYAFLCAAFCFFCALRNIPGRRVGEGSGAGGNIMVMLDVSQSMRVADMQGNQLRIDTAKELITTLMTKLPGSHWGLGIFAGEAQAILPLTSDYSTYTSFLAGVDHTNLVKQGTSLEEALRLGVQRFDSSEEKANILMIISDGGEEEIKQQARIAETMQSGSIALLVVGIGTQKGGPIIEGTDMFGNPVMKQRQGQTVISTLGEKSLKSLANQYDGTYLPLYGSSSDRIFSFITHIARNTPTPSGEKQQKATLTPFFVLVGLLSLLVGVTCPRWWEKGIKVVKRFGFDMLNTHAK